MNIKLSCINACDLIIIRYKKVLEIYTYQSIQSHTYYKYVLDDIHRQTILFDNIIY